MDKISRLPDELLVKILSFVPTKVAVSTSILSKRWQFLWMWLPKLEYSTLWEPTLPDFIDKTLPLHRAPVIERLRLGISDPKTEDFKRWVEIAVSRSVREMEISLYSDDFFFMFPSSFYTCESLVFLQINAANIMDSWTHTMIRMYIPSMNCFPSLKTLNLFLVILMYVPSEVCFPSVKSLELQYVTYPDDESLQGLLSTCPVLEDLTVRSYFDERKKFTIIVPTLQSLSLLMYLPSDGYVIDTPSLKYFKLEDRNPFVSDSQIKDMPELREAYVDVLSHNLKSVIGSITSVKRLTICSEILNPGEMYDVYVFNQLKHLKLCVCNKDSSDLLARLLKDSPNLRVLDLFIMGSLDHWYCDQRIGGMVCWNQPSHVPECLLSSLQIFNWSRYFGRPQDRDIAVYILKNACHLKTATILADTSTMEHNVSNLEMVKELTLSSRASSTCELVFVEDEEVHIET